MKNLLYVIAGLLLIIWGIIYWGFDSSSAVHFILAIVVIIILVRVIFRNQLSNNEYD
jgi:Flp pilus assembly protein TadB